MFIAIGRWYVDFSQTSDQQVQALLRQAWQRERDEQDQQP
jgi:predicted phosphoribosyltransferase